MEYAKDAELGAQVHEKLRELGIETPAEFGRVADSEEEIREKFQGIMELMGLNLEDDSLQGTPSRVAKMFAREIFYGLDYGNFPKCTRVQNQMNYDEMVIERNILVRSSCEHHFVPFNGVAHVGYIPGDAVIGLSKLNRIVDFFSRRPQIQERLTAQIAETLKYVLNTSDVMVVVSCTHNCVKTRGVMDACSDTLTSKIGGIFTREKARAEFLSLINLPNPGS